MKKITLTFNIDDEMIIDENDNIIKPGTTVIICNPSIITKEYRMQK